MDLIHTLQCLRNYISTLAFADVSYLVADVKANFFVWKCCYWPMLMNIVSQMLLDSLTSNRVRTVSANERRVACYMCNHSCVVLDTSKKIALVCQENKKLLAYSLMKLIRFSQSLNYSTWWSFLIGQSVPLSQMMSHIAYLCGSLIRWFVCDCKIWSMFHLYHCFYKTVLILMLK